MRKCRAFCDSASTPEGTRWTTRERSILVVGAGDATGGAIARRFAREGYVACVTRRSADKLAAAGRRRSGRRRRGARLRLAMRARRRRSIALVEHDRARDRADRGRGLQHRRQRALRASPRRPRASTARSGRWPRFAGFLMGREVAKAMVPRGRGTIIFTGATASAARLARASPPSPAPSTRCARWRRAWRASSGRRASTSRTSSSTARSTPRSSRENFPERYALKEQDGILNPEHIADNYWMLHRQPRERLDARARPAAVDGKLVSPR